MTNIIIDKDRALELLAEAVKLKGADYVDVGTDPDGDGECRYYAFTLSQEKDDEDDWRNDGTVVTATIGEDGRAEPGCIVGHVYYALGFDPLDITAGVVYDTLYMNGEGSGAVFSAAGATELLTKDGDTVSLTPEAQGVLSTAQCHQDGGHTWGSALEEAEKAGGR
jgi:hypothetical protein